MRLSELLEGGGFSKMSRNSEHYGPERDGLAMYVQLIPVSRCNRRIFTAFLQFVCLCGFLSIHLSVAIAREPEPKDRSTGSPLAEAKARELQSAVRFTDFSDKFNWDEQTEFIDRALDNVWEQYGWKDDADRYALKFARDISAIPPWKFVDRFNLASKRLADRYELNSAQLSTLQKSLIREVSAMVFQNADLMMQHANEMFDTRMHGKPFTSEQIAGWVKESDHLVPLARDAADRVIAELRSELTEDQREILDKDVRSFDKRFGDIVEARKRWAAGDWHAEDWGLEDDPIQNSRARGILESAARADRAKDNKGSPDVLADGKSVVLPTKWVDHDPATWIAYRLDFQKKYRLNAGQIDTAESIHIELRDRATAYLSTNKSAANEVAYSERGRHETFKPVRMMFEELRVRLDALLTSAQKQLFQRRQG